MKGEQRGAEQGSVLNGKGETDIIQDVGYEMKDSNREGQTDISTGLKERKLIEEIQYYLSHARVKCHMCTRCISFYCMS